MVTVTRQPHSWATSGRGNEVCEPCGWRLRRGARFCDGCGVRLQLGSRRTGNKHATVMFADVVGSMQIAAALGPERFWEVIVEVVDRCVTVVRRHGGSMDTFTGDGVMAVFEAPVALEEQAFRACRAALDIHADVDRLAANLKRRDGISLRLRIGLNSGEVTIGQVGPAAVGYTAIGANVGFAQRMESVAPPGGVLLSESTARLVDGAAVLGALELVRVKGIGTSVPARRLLALEIDSLRRAAS